MFIYALDTIVIYISFIYIYTIQIITISKNTNNFSLYCLLCGSIICINVLGTLFKKASSLKSSSGYLVVALFSLISQNILRAASKKI